MSEIKVMNDDEIRDFCIKKDLRIFELEQEIERLHSIIKEVREYITGVYDSLENVDRPIKLYEDILEILNKENEK